MLGAVVGSAVTSLVAIATYYLTAPGLTLNHRTTTVLAFYNYSEDLEEIVGADTLSDAVGSNRTAKILRDCGAWYFETENEGDALSSNALFPIIPQNSKSLGCVLSATSEADIPMKIESRWELDLEEILSSANAPAPN